jgi:hypothetical protein
MAINELKRVLTKAPTIKPKTKLKINLTCPDKKY